MAVVKRIKQANLRAVQEASILQKCDHRFVVKYLESFFIDGKISIVMEYMDRGTLMDFIGKARKEEHQVWRFLSHISCGLEYLHNRAPEPILHRDIKPDNILGKTCPRTGQIVLKLADFGIAKLLKKKHLEEFYTASVVGCVIYMAPEIMDVELGVEDRYGIPADIWSLGAVMSFRCSEKHLFTSPQPTTCSSVGRVIPYD